MLSIYNSCLIFIHISATPITNLQHFLLNFKNEIAIFNVLLQTFRTERILFNQKKKNK